MACFPPPDTRPDQEHIHAGGLDLVAVGKAGELGSPLLAGDLPLLQLRPQRPFAAGELCAYRGKISAGTAAARAAQHRAAGRGIH